MWAGETTGWWIFARCRAAEPGGEIERPNSAAEPGVATDYTELLSIKDTTKSWKIALFLPLVAVPQVMLVGFILNGF